MIMFRISAKRIGVPLIAIKFPEFDTGRGHSACSYEEDNSQNSWRSQCNEMNNLRDWGYN